MDGIEDMYELEYLIGSGGFGTVYEGREKINTNKKVAIKIETKEHSLKREHEVYKKLCGKDSIGIAKVKLFGHDDEMDICYCDDYHYGNKSYLVMELLGPDLEKLLQQCSGKFSLKTVLLLANQMIAIIQYVHSKGYIHGDVKPGNFLVGRKKKNNVLYMVDFGLAKMYRDPRTNEHIPYNEDSSYGGTTRFTSINCHQRLEQSRRDDLESLGYVLLYLLRGNLPWQGLEVSETSKVSELIDRKKKKRKLVYKKKLSTTIEELCPIHPSEFATYMKYCRSLQFDEEPDYTYLQKLFKDLFDRSGYLEKSKFDWLETIKETKETSKTDQFVKVNKIHACRVNPWEAKLFLDVKYKTLHATTNIQEATVEQYVEEAFRFFYPEYVPKFFDKTHSATWKSLAPELCSRFYDVFGNWLKDNFTLDYETANSMEHYHQSMIIADALEAADSDRNTASAQIAVCIHRELMESISMQVAAAAHAKKGKKSELKSPQAARKQHHDRIVTMMYRIFGYLNILFLTNGSCQFNFKMRQLPIRFESRGDIMFTATPDVTLCQPHLLYSLGDYTFCVVECKSESSLYLILLTTANCQLRFFSKLLSLSVIYAWKSLPYYTDKVYGPQSDTALNKMSRLELQSSCSSLSTEDSPAGATSPAEDSPAGATSPAEDSPAGATSPAESFASSSNRKTSSADDDLADRIQKLALKNEEENYGDKKDHCKINKSILKSTPFHSWPDHSAVEKVTGQLVIEMYGALVHAHQHEGVVATSGCELRKCMGIFVNNDILYIAKLQQSVYSLQHMSMVKVPGPQVTYWNWNFDLRKPNARLGFLIFMYHYNLGMIKKEHPY